ncbi:hypothetical protein C3F09_01355 [candidate division GN15 bacterium]|uniref:Uncharacterized protein n=1 Tax=candidate division GN15 bacterium TaxID=2072418 RepID=A0A855X5Z1_9BACT|nr:MAG: hypothetical protein C3F09_01355 [candidate division GN15 bacterium]
MLCAIAIGVAAQDQRALAPAQSFLQYRPMGEKRLWTFVAKDSTIGQLTSIVEGETTINGIAGLTISEDLNLDFRKLGTASIQHYTAQHFVTLTGQYLGDELTATVNEQTGSLSLRRNGDVISGYSERGGEKTSQQVSLPPDRFAWDNFFVDQLEAYLAMRGVHVGDVIDDSVFAPLPLLVSRIRGEVVSYGWIRLYNQKFDSAFIIDIHEPQTLRLYYSKDRRLQKIEAPLQEMKIYLDLVAPKQVAQPQSASFSLTQWLQLLPLYGLYLLVAVLVAWFYLRGRMRFGEHYLGVVLGMLVMWLIPVTQVPLQEWVIRQWLLPGLKSGQSIFVLGLLPAIIAGLVQGLLLTISIFFLLSWRGFQHLRALSTGALCGAGFGFMLACYLSSQGGASWDIDTAFMERVFQIAFHIASGVIIAVLYCRGLMSAIRGAAILSGINTLFYYFVVFAQQRMVDAGMLAFLLAFTVLGTSVWAVTLQSKASRK